MNDERTMTGLQVMLAMVMFIDVDVHEITPTFNDTFHEEWL
jgi:hypothetical protein